MTNEEIMKSFYSSDISFSELIDFGLTRKISINEELIDIEREKEFKRFFPKKYRCNLRS